jgi:hypothetical protein
MTEQCGERAEFGISASSFFFEGGNTEEIEEVPEAELLPSIEEEDWSLRITLQGEVG